MPAFGVGSVSAALNPPLERRSPLPEGRGASSWCGASWRSQATLLGRGDQASRVVPWPSGSLDVPALLVNRHAHHLVDRRRGLGGLGRAEAEVFEDSGNGDLVVQVRDDLELAPTLRAGEGIDVEDLRDEPYAEFGIRLIMPATGLCRVARGAACYSLDLVAVRARGRLIRSA